MNDFFNDAEYFSRIVATKLNECISDDDCVQLTLNWALGIEHILKGILYDVNPVYVLINPEFKNSAKTIYKAKIIPDAANSSELVQKPDFDVLTMKNSLLRAQHFSKTVFDNKSLIFFLSQVRDIIVHHNLKLLDTARMKETLFSEFYRFIAGIVKEQNLKLSSYLKGREIPLREIASKHQVNIEERLNLLFQNHVDKYRMLKGNKGYSEEKVALTEEVFGHKFKKYKMKCPACGETALIYTRPVTEYNGFEGREITTGFEITKLKCFFCKLELEDYKEIEFLKLYDRVNEVDANLA